jgi:alkylhydroperoxidase family enzyme
LNWLKNKPKGNSMSRIPAINPSEATGKVKELLDAVQTKLGVTPNMARTMAQSPAVLEAYIRSIVENRGAAPDADLEAVKNAGFSEGEIAEVIANVALNIFTNYFNEAAKTEIDFPRVELPLKRSVSKA